MPNCRAATIKNPDDLLRDNPTAIIMGRRDAGILILIVAVFSSRSPRYSDASQHVSEPGLRVDIVEFGRADQRVDRRGALATTIGAGEQPSLAAKRHRGFIVPVSGRK